MRKVLLAPPQNYAIFKIQLLFKKKKYKIVPCVATRGNKLGPTPIYDEKKMLDMNMICKIVFLKNIFMTSFLMHIVSISLFFLPF